MTYTPSVSVIVPVYNAGLYLAECLDSLLVQTLKSLEFIVVNDGSTDNSREIILQYSKRDPRIICVDIPNSGVSKARNTGLEMARGEYIGFVDADDFVQAAMFEKMTDKAQSESADLVICNAFMEDGRNPAPIRLNFINEVLNLPDDKEKIVLSFLEFRYDFATWNKLYKRFLIEEHQLRFHNDMYIWEDALFNLEYIQYSQVVITITQPLYHYRVHDASIMSTTQQGFGRQYSLFYESFARFCTDNGFNDSLKIFADYMIQNAVATLMLMIDRKPGSKRFSFLCRNLSQELNQLGPSLLVHDIALKTGRKVQPLLLRKRYYTMFSLLYVTRIHAKKLARKCISAMNSRSNNKS